MRDPTPGELAVGHRIGTNPIRGRWGFDHPPDSEAHIM